MELSHAMVVAQPGYLITLITLIKTAPVLLYKHGWGIDILAKAYSMPL